MEDDKMEIRPGEEAVSGEKAVWRRELPQITDPVQRRAGKRVLWFLALMLVFTLVARGTAGATVPKVGVTSPSQSEIVESVSGDATVKAKGLHEVKGPTDLTPVSVMAEAGATLEKGDAVAKYDLEQVRQKLAREQVNLDGMRVKVAQLERGESYDATALESAQRNLARAREDYDKTVAAGNEAIAAAKTALENAKASEAVALEEAQKAGKNGTAEEQQAAQEALLGAREARAQAEGALAEAEGAAPENTAAAARTLEDANTDLASAQVADEKARQEAADQAAQNQVDAATQRLDIAEQEKKVKMLQEIVAAEGVLKAGRSGTVTEVMEMPGETGALLKMSGKDDGFEAEATVSKKDAQKISPGDECEVTTGGSTGYYSPTATGKVAAISEPDGEGMVKLTLKLPEGDWKQGQQIEMKAVISSKSYPTCLPLSALRSDNSGYFVLAVEPRESVLGVENRAVRVDVDVVAQDGKNAAVEGALSSGDSVVTDSDKPVEAGGKVRVNADE